MFWRGIVSLYFFVYWVRTKKIQHKYQYSLDSRLCFPQHSYFYHRCLGHDHSQWHRQPFTPKTSLDLNPICPVPCISSQNTVLPSHFWHQTSVPGPSQYLTTAVPITTVPPDVLAPALTLIAHEASQTAHPSIFAELFGTESSSLELLVIGSEGSDSEGGNPLYSLGWPQTLGINSQPLSLNGRSPPSQLPPLWFQKCQASPNSLDEYTSSCCSCSPKTLATSIGSGAMTGLDQHLCRQT